MSTEQPESGLESGSTSGCKQIMLKTCDSLWLCSLTMYQARLVPHPVLQRISP